eukprot:SAG31_NODE_1755_length_7344_cov_7.207039_9_plen_104_part_00
MEIHCDGNNGGARPAHVEPAASGVAFQTAAGSAVPFRVSPRSWGTMLNRPVVSHGRERWSASQAIPGAGEECYSLVFVRLFSFSCDSSRNTGLIEKVPPRSPT